MRKVLLYFAIKYQGDYKKILKAIEEKEQIEKQELERVESSIKCNYMTLIDSDYPEFLKNIIKEKEIDLVMFGTEQEIHRLVKEKEFIFTNL